MSRGIYNTLTCKEFVKVLDIGFRVGYSRDMAINRKGFEMVVGLYVQRRHVDSWILAEVFGASTDEEIWSRLVRFSMDNPDRNAKVKVLDH